MMSLRLLSSVIFLICSLLPSLSAEHTSYIGQNRFDLLQRSLKTPSAAERAIIRAHLASVEGETAEGLFSAAWLASVDGRLDDEIRLYEKAIEQDPELTVGYVNLALAHERAGRPETAKDLYDKALTTAPFDVDLVRNGFFVRKEQLGDAAGAEQFLNHWEMEVGSTEYAFDFVRGIAAEIEGRYEDAEQFLHNAIAKDAPFQVYERLSNLRLNRLSNDSMMKTMRLAYVTQVLDPLMKEDRGEAAAYLFVGRMLRDRFDARQTAVEYLQAGFDLYPNAEAAADVFAAMAHYDFEGGRAFLEKADSILPGNYDLKNSLAWMNYHFLANPEKAASLALQSAELAPHDEGRLAAMLSLGTARQYYGQFDEAYAFYRKQLSLPWSKARREHILIAMTENRIAAQDFVGAEKHLDAIRSAGAGNIKWLDWKAAVVAQALILQAQTGEALERHPFLISWIESFGELETQKVSFALGSAVVPASARVMLDKIAELLTQPGNEKAFVSIEGHSDTTGDPALNDELSCRRALAVQDYLGRRHGIDRSRLHLANFGARAPLASNADRSGRIENRRADIRPFVDTGQLTAARPEITEGNALSSDGSHAVLGQRPPRLWDIRANVKQHDLYRARNSRFSPDGRHVAAISSYHEVGGNATEAVYIYETTSGRAVAQLHEPNEIVDLAWRPDGEAIVFSTADGFLKLYDIPERKYAAVARIGPVRIGGPITWLADGSAIASGQHRMGDIVILNPQTLVEQRRLTGVDWPHAIGASPDSRYLLAFDNRLRMSVWDMRDWSGPLHMGTPMIPQQLEFHPERHWVVFNAKFEASKVSLAVIDYARLATVATWEDTGTYAFGLSYTGETVTAMKGRDTLLFDTASLGKFDELLLCTCRPKR